MSNARVELTSNNPLQDTINWNSIKVTTLNLGRAGIAIGYDHPDKNIEIRSPLDFSLIRSFPANGESVSTMIMLKDGTLAIGGSKYNDHIRIYDPLTGELLRQYSQHQYDVACMELLPNGKLVVGSKFAHFSGQLRIIDIQHHPTDINFIPTEIYSQNHERIIRIFAVTNNSFQLVSDTGCRYLFDYIKGEIIAQIYDGKDMIEKSLLEMDELYGQKIKLPDLSEDSNYNIRFFDTKARGIYANLTKKNLPQESVTNSF